MLRTTSQHKDIAESHGLPKPEADGALGVSPLSTGVENKWELPQQSLRR